VERLRAAPGWRELPAVREGRIALVDADLSNRPGPAIAESAERMAEALRPSPGPPMTPAVRLLLLALLLLGALLLGVGVGAVPIGPLDVLDAIRGVGDPSTVTIVQNLRLPRTVLAALVGAGLAASGATFQALLRNPLAEPYILGVSGGRRWARWGRSSSASPPSPGRSRSRPSAGAIVAILLVLRIAVSVGGALDTRVLLLSGVVVGAFFNACILLALTFSDTESFRSAIFWMMGSFSGATWRASSILALYLLPALLLLLALARPLNLLSIGEETAAYLGISLERTKLLAFGTASLLAASAVAVSGVIGFVGLIVPHVIRIGWGSDYRFLIPASALLGAAFLVATDALARTAAAPNEIPIGVVTAFVGVPFFLWLLRQEGRVSGWAEVAGARRGLRFRYPEAARDAVAGVSPAAGPGLLHRPARPQRLGEVHPAPAPARHPPAARRATVVFEDALWASGRAPSSLARSASCRRGRRSPSR
jgi:iron complex transport system permease protein